nr:M15 family metallopeptidase [Nocardioides sp. MAH-18]
MSIPRTLPLLLAAVVTAGCGTVTQQGSSDPARLSAGLVAPKNVPGDPTDHQQATIRKLDSALLDALTAATADARADGVTLVVNSGWRSRAHQQRLFDEAVRTYGSEEEARRYVSTPEASAHVTGDALDIGPTEAAEWLSRHGAAYGLCQVFANEVWHYELATTPGGACPAMLPDSSYRG